MKKYQREGVRINGDVLSCDPSKEAGMWDISVLYAASEHKYGNSSRGRFRYPNAQVEKRFLRRFQIQQCYERGTTLPVLTLKSSPRTGLLEDLVYLKLQNHSHLRTILILVPGTLLLAMIMVLAVLKILSMEGSSRRMAWVAFSVVSLIIVLACLMLADARFQVEKRQKYESAIPMTTKSSKSEPLLSPSDHPVP